MQTVKVDLADRSYMVYIGSGILGKQHPAFDVTTESTVLIVSNETVAPLYMETAKKSLAGADVHSLILPDGETGILVENHRQADRNTRYPGCNNCHAGWRCDR